MIIITTTTGARSLDAIVGDAGAISAWTFRALDEDGDVVDLSAKTVTLRANKDSEEKLLYAGADRVISPYVISGRRMATFLLRPVVFDYLDLVVHGSSLEYRLEELVVKPGSSIAGKTMGELDIKARTGTLVLAIRKAEGSDFNTNPDRNTLIEEWDLLVALGTEKDLAELEKMVES